MKRLKILITGATDGIGRLAAIELARGGADLIITARSEAKAEDTRAAIAVAAPAASVEVHYVDFTDLPAVVATGRLIALQHENIDVLINNAGLHAFEQRITKDGYAEMLSVNYFAPWLLTQTLLKALVGSAPSRIVTVASEASRQAGAFDMDRDLLATSDFSVRGSSRIYGLTKLLDIMFSLELARRLSGTSVAVNCLCPGFNVTSLGRELSFSGWLSPILKSLGIGNPARGAEIICRLATGSGFARETGQYLSVKNARPLVPVYPANDDLERRRLWELTNKVLSRFLLN